MIITYKHPHFASNRCLNMACRFEGLYYLWCIPAILVVCELLTHWGRVPRICVGKLTVIGSDNGLSPGRRQAIIWTNAGILSIGPLGTNLSEILSGIQKFSFRKMPLKISYAKWHLFGLGLNELTHWGRDKMTAISQTILSNAFSWMKMLELRLKFHWSLFPRVQLTIYKHWFRWWLGAGQATSHCLN